MDVQTKINFLPATRDRVVNKTVTSRVLYRNYTVFSIYHTLIPLLAAKPIVYYALRIASTLSFDRTLVKCVVFFLRHNVVDLSTWRTCSDHRKSAIVVFQSVPSVYRHQINRSNMTDHKKQNASK